VKHRGLRLEGPARQRRRKTLILDAEAHRYDKSLPDISGMDIEAHGNDVRQVIRQFFPARRPLDPHDDLPHGGYLHVVEIALLRIEAARAAPP
jgi:hypothetical protein